VPAGETWEILSAYLEIDTDANVANRQLQINAFSSTIGLYLIELSSNLVASTSYTISFGIGVQEIVGVTGNDIVAPIPDRLIITAGGSIEASLLNPQAGDDILSFDIAYNIVPT